MSQIQTLERGLEAKKLQQEVQEAQLSEEEVQGKISKVTGETDIQGQMGLRLENGTKAVGRSLDKPPNDYRTKKKNWSSSLKSC